MIKIVPFLTIFVLNLMIYRTGENILEWIMRLKILMMSEDEEDAADDDVAVKERGRGLPRSTKRDQRGLYVVFGFIIIVIITIIIIITIIHDITILIILIINTIFIIVILIRMMMMT